GARGKRFPARRFVGELETLAPARKRHGMIADDIATANRVNADLRRRTLPRQTLATVRNILRVIELPRLAQDLRQFLRRAAGRIFLQTMMRLDNFQVEILAKHSGRLPR